MACDDGPWCEAQAAVGELLIGASSLTGAGPSLLERLARSFDWALCELWMLHHDRTTIRCEASWGAPGLPDAAASAFGATRAFSPGEGFPGKVWSSSGPIRCADLCGHPDFERKEMARALGLTAGLAFPILTRESDVTGVVLAFGRETDLADPAPETLLALGHRIGDFTTRLQAEERRRNDQLATALGRLSSTLADKLNNELCVVLTEVSRLLGDRGLGEDLREGLDEIRHAATRAASASRRFLDEASPGDQRVGSVDLGEVVRRSLPTLQGLLDDGVRLEVLLEDGLFPVLGNRDALGAIIRHLVVNAGEAITGDGHVVIRCGRTRDEAGDGAEQVTLAVTDSGAGMDEELRSRVFEPLFSGCGRGGMGLTQVYSQVKRLGGEVEVRSRPGAGSTFDVRLPLATTEAPGALEDSRLRDPGLSEDLLGTALLVEDSPALRRQLRRIMEEAGLRVLEAADAEAALALCEHGGQPLDLLVSDVGLPGLSGPELVERIRRAHPDVPVLFISGYPRERLEQDLCACSYDLFLQKPFERTDLLLAVRRTLRSRRALAAEGGAPWRDAC